MSRSRTFTFHLCDPAQHTPGDAAILDAIQAHLRESGEIPDCTRSQALRWALNRLISVDNPVFRHQSPRVFLDGVERGDSPDRFLGDHGAL